MPNPSRYVLRGQPPFDVAPTPPATVTNLPALFNHQARTHPSAIAFSCTVPSNGLTKLSYREAEATSTRIALRLRSITAALSSQPDQGAPVVAVWLEKGLPLVLSILAVTYSGATWLPFDPDVPAERASVCVADSGATVLLCDDTHLERAGEVQRRAQDSAQILEVIPFTQLQKDGTSERASSEQLDLSQSPRTSDAAYLIYTSGTTGTPKGIAIPHSAALTFALSERSVLGTTLGDVVWNGFSPAFDMFVEEMFVTIAGAAHLAIGTREECRDVPNLPALWAARGVSIVNAVPTLIGIMGIASGGQQATLLPACVRLINLGGEACPPALVGRLQRPGLRIINTYGPTETTVTATWDELTSDAPVTIGRPLPSYEALLLPIADEEPQMTHDSSSPLEITEGAEGELAIGGPCVGLGYVGRDELTASKFIRHPWTSDGHRIYRTGDRVRLTADLKILFLGRTDTQVKHRGFRIELGEIESVLSDHRDVQAAAVILANPGTDDAELQAFVVTASDAVREPSSLKKLAASHSPAYMVPEKIWYMDSGEMPRLPSGKINGKALHTISAERSAAEAALIASQRHNSKDNTSTDTAVDKDSAAGILLAVLKNVFLSAGTIAMTSDFFTDLGGHSLLAAVLVSQLRSNPIYASVGLPDIYECRTVEAIAARFDRSTKSVDSEQSSDGAYAPGDALLDGTGPSTGEHLPVSQKRFALCGAAQVPPLLFFFFLHSIEFLVPYLLFDYVLGVRGVGWALLSAYGVFVITPMVLCVIAIVGKWLVIGRAKEGEYPLYGVYYYRWWLAERFIALADIKKLADSPLYPRLLRCFGAKVGKHCYLGSLEIGAAADLIEIGNDVVIGSDVVLAVSLVERGRLILKRVVIKDDAIVGSNSVIEGGALMEDGVELGPLSMLPDGAKVPALQRWHGSPACYEREVKVGEAALGKASRPSSARSLAVSLGHAAVASFLLPLLYLMPQIPGLLLFDLVELHSIGGWAQVAVLSLPITFAYQLIVYFQLVAYRWIFLPRLREGTHSVQGVWYLRKWFIERLMDLSLDVLHPVFASLYIVPFLRMLGVKIGRRAEVSTAKGLQFELLDIGDECFIADSVVMGNVTVRGNQVTLKKTQLQPRSFAGNASLIPQGTVLPSGALVGVLSIAPPPDKPLASDMACFGSPPVLMPSRQREDAGLEANRLYSPSANLIATRLLIEGLRIILPRALIVFGIGLGLQVAYIGYDSIGAVYTLLMLPLFYFFFFALPCVVFTVALKWVLVGDYRNRPTRWALWSLNVWFSEAVVSTWETIAEPLLGHLLVGTPFLAWVFRGLGVNIGSRVTLLSSDITEHDLVTLEDEAVINRHSGPQTHTFSDRVCVTGTVHLGKRAVIKPYAIALPGSRISDGAQLGSLSLLMKGETLPPNTAWEGAPTRPRAQRKRAPAPVAIPELMMDSEKTLWGRASKSSLQKTKSTLLSFARS
ncbi:unnamed protein product [Jaminaea pallidilutea]